VLSQLTQAIALEPNLALILLRDLRDLGSVYAQLADEAERELSQDRCHVCQPILFDWPRRRGTWIWRMIPAMQEFLGRHSCVKFTATCCSPLSGRCCDHCWLPTATPVRLDRLSKNSRNLHVGPLCGTKQMPIGGGSVSV
jgi:hypothetical protein